MFGLAQNVQSGPSPACGGGCADCVVCGPLHPDGISPIPGLSTCHTTTVALSVPPSRCTSASRQEIAPDTPAGDSSARQTRAGREAATSHSLDNANQILTGLGSPVPIELAPDNPVVGKTLAQIKLRGLTGATVLAIQRGNDAVLIPSGHERLQAGDVLAVAGTHEALKAAKQLLSTS